MIIGMIRRSHVTCILEDGFIRQYDACSSKENAYDTRIFEYMGKGKIHEINGKSNHGYNEDLHFYKYKVN